MYVAVYAKDKPETCRECFWSNKKGRCRLGQDNCYYIKKVIAKRRDPCEGCPYSRGGPCIGWCTMKLLDRFDDIKAEEEVYEDVTDNGES